MRYQIAKFVKSFRGIALGRQRIVAFSSILKSQLFDTDYRVLAYPGTSCQHLYLSRFKSRCFLTGRSRFVISKYRISRIKFKEICTDMILPGYKKSQW